jgi:hypothetical protein
MSAAVYMLRIERAAQELSGLEFVYGVDVSRPAVRQAVPHVLLCLRDQPRELLRIERVRLSPVARITLMLNWEQEDGRDDPEQRYAIYRLCDPSDERSKELVATCATPEALGVALVTLGREGEFEECPVGVLDRQGEKGKKWLIRPWLPSARNVSDAGRVLRQRRYTQSTEREEKS